MLSLPQFHLTEADCLIFIFWVCLFKIHSPIVRKSDEAQTLEIYNTYVTLYSNKFTLKKILLLGLGRFYRIIAPHVEGNYVIKALGKEARLILGFALRH